MYIQYAACAVTDRGKENKIYLVKKRFETVYLSTTLLGNSSIWACEIVERMKETLVRLSSVSKRYMHAHSSVARAPRRRKFMRNGGRFVFARVTGRASVGGRLSPEIAGQSRIIRGQKMKAHVFCWGHLEAD